jgi:hypothetical protein
MAISSWLGEVEHSETETASLFATRHERQTCGFPFMSYPFPDLSAQPGASPVFAFFLNQRRMLPTNCAEGAGKDSKYSRCNQLLKIPIHRNQESIHRVLSFGACAFCFNQCVMKSRSHRFGNAASECWDACFRGEEERLCCLQIIRRKSVAVE